eukprot:jgi/Psemu1/212173/e_gw1.592.15.1
MAVRSTPCHGFFSLPVVPTKQKLPSPSRWEGNNSDTGKANSVLQQQQQPSRASFAAQIFGRGNNNDDDDETRPDRPRTPHRLGASIAAAILSVAISVSASAPAPCHALTPDQLLVDDVWREVSRQYVDPTFNGQGEQGWAKQRFLALQTAADLGPDDDARLYGVIRGMLRTLGDPYTRFLTPDQFRALTQAYARPDPASTSAKTTTTTTTTTSTSGIGVQLIGDNSGDTGGFVVVVNTVAKSPASNSGILPGDKIVSVDGVDMAGATAEVVAAKCRGATGTTVSIEIERPASEGSSSSSSSSSSLSSSSSRTTVSVERAPIAPIPSIEASTAVVGPSQQKVGIVTIRSFTQDTESLVRNQLGAFRDSPPSALALDLRGNVGGYMPAGVDVAKLFLPPKARIVSEVDRTGRATIYINDGVGSQTDTSTPLYLLVDRKTASASEILAGALQDNGRAVVVSSSAEENDRTFGKGRIQNVQALSYGGSGIAVTKARYTTPSGKDIQGVGIAPDRRSGTCAARDSAAVCLEGIL